MKKPSDISSRDSQSLNAEYLMLREESQSCFRRQQEWSTFSIMAVITLLGIAMNLENQIPEFYLLPYIVLIIASAKVHNLRESILNIAGYMIAFEESEEGFYWETALNSFRKTNFSNNWKRKMQNRLVNFFETQEFTFMGIICLLLFLRTVLIENSLGHILHLVELLFSMLAICFISTISQNYFTFGSEEVNNRKRLWDNNQNLKIKAKPRTASKGVLHGKLGDFRKKGLKKGA